MVFPSLHLPTAADDDGGGYRYTAAVDDGVAADGDEAVWLSTQHCAGRRDRDPVLPLLWAGLSGQRWFVVCRQYSRWSQQGQRLEDLLCLRQQILTVL